jgi:hypothetical protein
MPLRFDRNNRSHLFDPGGDQQIAVNDEQGQALARGSQVGDASMSARIKTALSKGARNKGHGTTMSLDNADAVNLPIGTAFLETGPSSVPFGARGRDPGGWPKVIPVGVPPAVSGEPRRTQVPKELRIPAIPGNFSSWVAVPGGSTGELLAEPVSFPARTLQIDNYTSSFIYVYGAERYIPPLTLGWQFVLGRGVTTIRCTGAAPPNVVQPAFVAGGVFYVFAFEAALSPNAIGGPA